MWLVLAFDVCRLAQIGNQVRLAWMRVSPHRDPDSNWPLLPSPILSSPLYLPHPSRFNLTLTGASDKTHYSLNYAIYLSSPSPPPPPLVFISSLSRHPYSPFSSSDAPGLVGALSVRRWRFPPDSITSLSALRISVLLISLGGTITFLFIRKTEQMWLWEGESNGGTTDAREDTLVGKRAV